MLHVKDFPKILSGQWLRRSENEEKELVGFCFDTRLYQKESIFLALDGKNHDAHTFLSQLDAKPVECFLVTKQVEFTHPTAGYFLVADGISALHALAAHKAKNFSGKILAITGSSGKTSLKFWMGAVLEKKLRTLCPEKSYNNHLGCPATILSLTKEHELCILEMGANSTGEIELLTKIAHPHMSLILNVGMAHIGRFGSLENTTKAKSEIFSSMRSPAVGFLPKNLNSLPLHQVQKKVLFDQAFPLPLEPKQASDPSWGQRLSLEFHQKKISFFLPLLGQATSLSFSAILAVAFELGFLPEEIIPHFLDLKPFVGRLYPRLGHGGVLLVDDSYNANPNSVLHLAHSLGALGKKRKILLLGDLAELEGFEKESAEYIAENFPDSQVEELDIYGNMAEEIFRAFQKKKKKVRIQLFSNQEDLKIYLKNLWSTLGPSVVVAYKGSRVSKIEQLMHSFLQ